MPRLVLRQILPHTEFDAGAGGRSRRYVRRGDRGLHEADLVLIPILLESPDLDKG